MEQFKWKLKKFMNGRNGPDELGRDIGIASILIYFFSVILKNPILYILAQCGLIYSMFRVVSRNTRKRRQENWKYKNCMQMYRFKIEMHKTYRIFKCKGCGRRIRVPRGKGKVEITCPLCGKKIIRRT